MRAPTLASTMRRVAAIAVAIGLVTTGCGDEGGGDAATTPTGSVEVVAIDIGYADSDLTATEGVLEITLVQDGDMPHDLVFEARTDVHLEVGPDARGATDAGVFDFDPGTYTFFCTLAGHRQAGMEGTLTVTEA